MTQKEVPQGPVREDGYVIDFEYAAAQSKPSVSLLTFIRDTRGFAAEKWDLAVEAQEISQADQTKGRDVTTSEQYTEWIRRSMYNSKTAQQKSHLQSLLLMTAPLLTFIDEFMRLVKPKKPDMSILWSLVYLNINVSTHSCSGERTCVL